MKRVLARVALVLACLPALLWAAGALHFDLPAPAAVRAGAALAWLLATLAAPLAARSLRRAALIVAVSFACVLGWWLTLRPRQDRDWLPEVARAPHSSREGERITLHDVRSFEYRTEHDYTPHYLDRTLRLENLRALDLFLCYWGSPLLAHPILSFDFGPDGRVCFSIETRKERGEGYSTLGGLYRQFELIYVVAEESDVVRLRAALRPGEEAYLYRLLTPPEALRELFLGYVSRIDELHERPEFYNVLTANCTTSIRMQRSPEERAPFDYRLLLNGRIDELLYEHGLLDRSVPFALLRERARVDPRSAVAGADFSVRIRAAREGGAGSPAPER